MTNEELEEVMNFIIKRQERITEQQEETQNVLAEVARRDDDKEQRIARFERSYIEIAELLKAHDAQLVEVTTISTETRETVENLARVAIRHDESVAHHEKSVARHDEQIAEMRESINSLTRTVERYINARGSNGNGAGD